MAKTNGTSTATKPSTNGITKHLIEIPVQDQLPEGMYIGGHICLNLEASDQEDKITLSSALHALRREGASVRRHGVSKEVRDLNDVIRFLLQSMTAARIGGAV